MYFGSHHCNYAYNNDVCIKYEYTQKIQSNSSNKVTRVLYNSYIVEREVTTNSYVCVCWVYIYIYINLDDNDDDINFIIYIIYIL